MNRLLLALSACLLLASPALAQSPGSTTQPASTCPGCFGGGGGYASPPTPDQLPPYGGRPYVPYNGNPPPGVVAGNVGTAARYPAGDSCGWPCNTAAKL